MTLEFDLRLPLGHFDLQAAACVGGTTAVLGASGSGKTSLLHAIAGLRRAEGRVVVDRDVLQDTSVGIYRPTERRQLGLVPQSGQLFPHLSVQRNLLFGVRGRRERCQTLAGREFRILVDALDLGDLLQRFPRFLSGGERRRVALGRALLARPRILLLDEPTEGLDADRSRRALAQVLQAARILDIPLLVVTHKVHEALALAQDVVVLDSGRLVAAGPVSTILTRKGLLVLGDEGRSANIVRGTVVGHEPADGVTLVDTGGEMPVSIPIKPDLDKGCGVVLSVDAEEILVSTREPAGLSARNVISGAIEAVWWEDGSAYVETSGWVARLTAMAARELSLEAGIHAWFVVKTHSWRVLVG